MTQVHRRIGSGRPHRRDLLVALTAAMTLLAGCSLLPDSAPTPSAPEVPTTQAPGVDRHDGDGPPAGDGPPVGDGATTAAEVRAEGVSVTSGSVAFAVLGQDVVQTPDADGSVTVTAVVPAETATVARIAVSEGLDVRELMDGSVVLRDAAGVAVGGLSAPELTAPPLDAPGDLRSTLARLEVTGDLIEVVLTPVTTSTALTVEVRLGTATIASTEWGDREGGRSLGVVPTAWLRTGALAAQEAGWAALVSLVPEVDTATMRDQFDCHALGARDKASWNLEPWRPDVGALGVLAAACNPT